MKKYPSIPRVENAPEEIFESGHLWILEKIDGANFRFQLTESGLIQFGDRSQLYEDPDSIPDPYRHAVRHIRENFDRDRFRSEVDNVESYVFFGEATHRHSIEYDWEKMPSFLGFDVWSSDRDDFYPFDRVEKIFDSLGLDSVNVIEREKRAKYFDPNSYSIPDSEWYDGQAEGVVIRNKRGQRVKLLSPEFSEVDDSVQIDESTDAEDVVEKYATQRRFEKTVEKLRDRGETPTFETVYRRVFEDVVREEHKQIYHSDAKIDTDEFKGQ